MKLGRAGGNSCAAWTTTALGLLTAVSVSGGCSGEEPTLEAVTTVEQASESCTAIDNFDPSGLVPPNLSTDMDGPTIWPAVLGPKDNLQGVVRFSATAWDYVSGLDQAALRIAGNGQNLLVKSWTKIHEETTFAADYYISQLPKLNADRSDGKYEVYFDFYDRAGNRNRTAAHWVSLATDTEALSPIGLADPDLQTPVGRLLAPAAGTVKGWVTFEAVLADDFQPDSAVFHMAEDKPGGKDQALRTFRGPEVQPKLSYRYDMSRLPAGKYKAYFDTYHMTSAGQVRMRSKNRSITVTQPETRLIEPLSNRVISGDTTLTARLAAGFVPTHAQMHLVVQPPESGGDRVVCASFELGADNGLYTCTFNPEAAGLEPGQYLFYFDAYDANGTRSRSGDANIRIAGAWQAPRVMYDHDYSWLINIPSFWESPNMPARWQDKEARWDWTAHDLLNPTCASVPGCTGILNTQMYERFIERSLAEIRYHNTVDTVVFAAGTGEVPIWNNDYYSFATHKALWEREFGVNGNVPDSNEYLKGPAMKYLSLGKYAVEVAHRNAKAKNLRFMVSMRMNDKHFTHVLDDVDKAFDGAKLLSDVNLARILGNSPSLFSLLSFQHFSNFFPPTDPLNSAIGSNAIGDDDDPFRVGSGYAHLLDYAKGGSVSTPRRVGSSHPRHLEINSYAGAAAIEDDVLSHKIRLIESLLRATPCLDGLLLDFMRIPHYFKLSTTEETTRKEVMAALITSVRAALDVAGDACADGSRYIPLLVQIPYYEEAGATLGIDLPRWGLAGVDGIIFGFERHWSQPYYYRPGAELDETMVDFAGVKAELGAVKTYQHIGYSTQDREVVNSYTGIHGWNCSRERPDTIYQPQPACAADTCEHPLSPDQLKIIDDQQVNFCDVKMYTSKRRTEREEMLTGARTAAQLGADGVYLFNFPYYRVSDELDPEQAALPPFDLMSCLDPANMSTPSCEPRFENPHYFLARVDALEAQELRGRYPMPMDLPTGLLRTLQIYAVRPPSGWPSEMRLVLEFEAELAGSFVDVWLNDNYIGEGGTSVDANAWTPGPFWWIARDYVRNTSGTKYFPLQATSDGFLCATGADAKKLRYVVPSEYLRDGANTLTLKRQGTPHRLGATERMQRVERLDLVPRFAD